MDVIVSSWFMPSYLSIRFSEFRERILCSKLGMPHSWKCPKSGWMRFEHHDWVKNVPAYGKRMYYMIFKVPSRPNHSAILCILCQQIRKLVSWQQSQKPQYNRISPISSSQFHGDTQPSLQQLLSLYTSQWNSDKISS